MYTRNQKLERHGHADKGKVKMTVTMPLLVLKLKFILAIFYPFLSHLVGMQDYIWTTFVSLYPKMYSSKINLDLQCAGIKQIENMNFYGQYMDGQI